MQQNLAVSEKADTGKLEGGGNSHGKMGLALAPTARPLTQARNVQTNPESPSRSPSLLPKSLTCNLSGSFQLLSVDEVNK